MMILLLIFGKDQLVSGVIKLSGIFFPPSIFITIVAQITVKITHVAVSVHYHYPLLSIPGHGGLLDLIPDLVRWKAEAHPGQIIAGSHVDKQPHVLHMLTLIPTGNLESPINLTYRIFGLWEETGRPGENPHKHADSMQRLQLGFKTGACYLWGNGTNNQHTVDVYFRLKGGIVFCCVVFNSQAGPFCGGLSTQQWNIWDYLRSHHRGHRLYAPCVLNLRACIKSCLSTEGEQTDFTWSSGIESCEISQWLI